MDRKEYKRRYNKLWAKRNPDKIYAAHRRWLLKNREKMRRYFREYQKLLYKRNPKKYQEAVKNWYKKNYSALRAHSLIAKAVKRGTIIKKLCEICDDPRVHAHHWAYKTLEDIYDITWLCPVHHKEAHRLMKLNS